MCDKWRKDCVLETNGNCCWRIRYVPQGIFLHPDYSWTKNDTYWYVSAMVAEGWLSKAPDPNAIVQLDFFQDDIVLERRNNTWRIRQEHLVMNGIYGWSNITTSQLNGFWFNSEIEARNRLSEYFASYNIPVIEQENGASRWRVRVGKQYVGSGGTFQESPMYDGFWYRSIESAEKARDAYLAKKTPPKTITITTNTIYLDRIISVTAVNKGTRVDFADGCSLITTDSFLSVIQRIADASRK